MGEGGQKLFSLESKAIRGVGTEKPKNSIPNKQTNKGCQSPSSVEAQSHRNCLCGSKQSSPAGQGQLLPQHKGEEAATGTEAPRACDSFLPPRQDCESGAHCSGSRCFAGRLISIKLPGLPVAQTDFTNTVLCGLGFIIPHVPPSQYCTR